ncbi:MAG: hypothetical protein AB1416_13600, partial [Actinomycetota bacterium]
MRAVRFLLAVTGVVACVVGVLAAIVGGLLVWASRSDTDRDGFFTSGQGRFATDSRAIVSDGVDLGDAPGWLGDRVGTIRIRARGAKPIFLGVGPRADVDRYLHGVARDVVTDLAFDPLTPAYRRERGTRTPARPAAQPFWVATAQGRGERRLTWDVRGGDWRVVAMNADGSAGIAVTADLGAKFGALVWAGVVLLAVGAGLLAVGVVLLRAVRRRRAPPAAR